MLTVVQSPVVDSLPRRSFLTGATAVGLGALVGCGSRGDGSPQARAGNGFPRTVDHEAGRTEIPAQPRRVVSATDYDDLDAVLAAGITPVAFGFSPWLVPGLTPWASGAAGSTRLDGPIAAINLEKIAAQRPDLIVAQADLLADAYPQLSAMAPTVVVAVRRGDWRPGTRSVGRATGQEAVAAVAIERAEAEVRRIGAELAAHRGARVAVISRFSGQIRVDSIPDGPAGSGALLQDLGMTPVDGGVDPASRVLADEELTRFGDVDALLVHEFDAQTDALIASPVFARLPVVRARRAMRLSRAATRASYLLSSLSVLYAAREFGTALRAAFEGRGSLAPVTGAP